MANNYGNSTGYTVNMAGPFGSVGSSGFPEGIFQRGQQKRRIFFIVRLLRQNQAADIAQGCAVGNVITGAAADESENSLVPLQNEGKFSREFPVLQQKPAEFFHIQGCVSHGYTCGIPQAKQGLAIPGHKTTNHNIPPANKNSLHRLWRLLHAGQPFLMPVTVGFLNERSVVGMKPKKYYLKP